MKAHVKTDQMECPHLQFASCKSKQQNNEDIFPIIFRVKFILTLKGLVKAWFLTFVELYVFMMYFII